MKATARSLLVQMGTALWSRTGSRTAREAYLKAFLWLVRGRRVLATVDGIRYDLDLGEMVDACLYLGRYEPEVTAAIERYCRSGWTALDIGANVGAHALRIARLVGPGGRVYAFEPTTYAYDKLVRNIALNGFAHVEAFRVALAEHTRAAQSMTVRASWRTDGSGGAVHETVDFVRADDWAQGRDLQRLDLIKLDVDGNEFPVLQGAGGLLRVYRPVVLTEVGAWHFADPGRNPLRLLEELDYRFLDTRLGGEFASLAEIRALLPERDENLGFSINVIAEPRASAPPPGRREAKRLADE